MTDCTQLIERLRFQKRYTVGQVPVTMDEAADAIEALQAKLDALQQQEPVGRFVCDGDCGHIDLVPYQGSPLVDGQAVYAAPKAQPDCRIELVTAIHGLASDFENRLGRLDPDDRKLAEGDIAHAMKVASKWNWNGTGAAPKAQEPEELIVNGRNVFDIDPSFVWSFLKQRSHFDVDLMRASWDALVNAAKASPVVQQAQEPEAWLPIETAPRDGTVIDLWVRPETGAARRFCGYWWLPGENVWRTGERTKDIPINYRPTHWRLPPAEPAREQTRNKA